jgi:hypothetical protein
MSIHLRIHGLEDELPVYAEWVRKNTTTCLIVKETGERGHIHCLIETKKKLAQFRKNMKERFPNLEGNKSYSMKDVKSQIGMEDYLCKGEHLGEMPFVYEKSPSWTEEKILHHHQSYWSRHTQETLANTLAKTGSDSIIPARPGKLKTRTPTAVEKIASKIRNFYGEEEISQWGYNNEITRKKILKLLLEYLRDLGKTLDIIVLKRIYFGVLHQLLPQQSDDYWEDALVRLLDADR